MDNILIGLNCDMSTGFEVLARGITFANFHALGKVEELKQLLIMYVRCSIRKI